jgi:hypothetical protein
MTNGQTEISIWIIVQTDRQKGQAHERTGGQKIVKANKETKG